MKINGTYRTTIWLDTKKKAASFYFIGFGRQGSLGIVQYEGEHIQYER